MFTLLTSMKFTYNWALLLYNIIHYICVYKIRENWEGQLWRWEINVFFQEICPSSLFIHFSLMTEYISALSNHHRLKEVDRKLIK